eukprot:1462353-Amphidinium_carterae.1
MKNYKNTKHSKTLVNIKGHTNEECCEKPKAAKRPATKAAWQQGPNATKRWASTTHPQPQQGNNKPNT